MRDILRELRDATADAHTRLEKAVKIEKRVQEVEDYRALLVKFWGWYEPLEGQVLQILGWPYGNYDPRARAKTSWVEHDLLILGLTGDEIAQLPRCEGVPKVQSLAAGFGCAYVMEGATLGGRHISGLMQGSPVPANARSFFHSYGAEVGAKWKEFVAALQEFAQEVDSDDEVISAAQHAFTSLESWLQVKARHSVRREHPSALPSPPDVAKEPPHYIPGLSL